MPALKDYGVRLTAAPNLHGHWVMTLAEAERNIREHQRLAQVGELPGYYVCHPNTGGPARVSDVGPDTYRINGVEWPRARRLPPPDEMRARFVTGKAKPQNTYRSRPSTYDDTLVWLTGMTAEAWMGLGSQMADGLTAGIKTLTERLGGLLVGFAATGWLGKAAKAAADFEHALLELEASRPPHEAALIRSLAEELRLTTAHGHRSSLNLAQRMVDEGLLTQTAHIVGASVVVQLDATVIVPPDKFPDVEEYFLLHGFAEDPMRDAGHRTWTKTDPDGMVHRWAGSRVVNPLVN
jgi:hypothetical protein